MVVAWWFLGVTHVRMGTLKIKEIGGALDGGSRCRMSIKKKTMSHVSVAHFPP